MTQPDFSAYLQSICENEKYRRWWSLYTVTDVEGKIRDESQFSPFDFGLMVERVVPQEKESRATAPKEKIERLPVLEGIRKYAKGHVLLVGRPGSGKSTALVRLLLEESSRMTQDNSPPSFLGKGAGGLGQIPILVELRQYQTSVLDLIGNVLRRNGLSLERQEIEQFLYAGQFLLLFDGVNELPNDVARRDLKAFRQNYRNAPAIFTTRDLGVGGNLGIEKKLEMQPLNETQMQQFVRAYLPQQGEEMLRCLEGRLREFGQTPLLLWMLCELFKQTGTIPPNLGLVFRCFAQSFECKIKEDVPVATESRCWWGELLQHLAFAMMQGETPTEFRVAISRREAEGILVEFLQDKVDYPPTRAKEFLEDLLEHHLLQLASNDQIEFRHQLLQEYYAAEALLLQLAKMSDAKLKRDYLNYLKWTEPVALMLALLEEETQAVRVVRLALEVDLMLGARLAGEVQPRFQEKTVESVGRLEIRERLKVELLGKTHSEFAVKPLRDRLQDKNSDVRSKAALALESLGNVHNDQSIALQNEYLKVCRTEGLKSWLINNPTAITLGLLLNDEDSDIRFKVVKFLERVGNETAVKLIIKALKDEDLSVRRKAAEALGKIGNETAVHALISVLQQDEDPFLYTTAEFALGNISNEAVVNLLISTLQASEVDVRCAAASALGNIGSEAAVNPLILALQDENSYVRSTAAYALGSIGNEAAVNPLVLALQASEVDVCCAAASALGNIGNEATVNPLVLALQASEVDVRSTAAYALGNIGNEAAVNPLILALQDENSYVRSTAACALGHIGHESAVNDLISVLQSSQRVVEALRKRLDVSSGSTFQMSLLEYRELCYFRQAAIAALGNIGNEAAVNPLIFALQDENSSVRWEAADALEKIAPDRALPQMWELLLTGKYNTTRIILKIQERCQFYNYNLFHSSPVEEAKGTQSEAAKLNTFIFNKEVGIVQTGEVNVQGNQTGIQHNKPDG